MSNSIPSANSAHALYQSIRYASSDGVATLRLNRPARRNALTNEMLTELADGVDRVAADASVRALVITGEGKGFCAGQDLTAFDGMLTGEAVRATVIDYYKPLILRLCTLEKPIIGAINGVAAGAGASLALACDLRVMAADASLMQAFINIGLVPDAGSSWFLARLVGYSRALEIAIEGERISAERCLELGIANRVVPADRLLAEAQQWAHHLAQRPTLAIGLTKKLLYQSLTSDLETILEAEAETQMQTIISADHRAGVTAFLEKRPPVFEGK